MSQEYNGYTIPAYTETLDGPKAFQDYTDDVITKLANKANLSGATYTGTHDFTGATMTGVPGGLTLITTAPVSGSSVSINGCFSTYDNYRILFTADSVSQTAAFYMRLRASGTDNTSANYSYAYFRHILSNGTLANYANGATQSNFGIGEANANEPYTVGIDVHSPNRSSKTTISWLGDSDTAHYSGGGMTTVTTAYDGFTVYWSSGTVTGALRVYGYKNA